MTIGRRLNVHPTRKPSGVKLEYRVKAVNTAGESIASNTMAAVL